MRKNKLITLLKIFSKEEMKDFEKFIVSPYFNNGRNFKPFYKILKKCYPDFESPDLTEENIFRELYPDKVYSKKSSLSIRVIESQMTRMAEKFLTIEEFTKSNDFDKCTFLRMLEKKGRGDLTVSYAKKFFQESEKEKISESYFLTQYLIRNLVSKVYCEATSKDWEIMKDNNVRAIDSLILFFVKQLTNYHGRLNVFSSKYLPESKILNEFNAAFDMNKFLDSLEKNSLMGTDLMRIEYYYYKIVTDRKDLQSYKMLKDLFFKIKDKMTYENKSEIFCELGNFCMYQSFGERKYYINQNIDIYIEWIKDAPKNSFDQVFSIRPIRNVIRDMAYTGRLDELKEFVVNYSDYFNPEIKVDCINYAYTILSFAKEEYEECLERISVMLQLEKEFQNNYFSKLKIKGDSENVRKKTSYGRTKSNYSKGIA